MPKMRFLSLIFLLFLASPAIAQPISLAHVIDETLANHPDIPLSQINVEFAKTAQERTHGLLDPSVAASINISDEQTTPTNPFAPNQSEFGLLSANIYQPLQDGSSITGSLAYNRNNWGYPASVPAKFQSSINPLYQNQIDLSYRYPLLRGHGNPAYAQQLEAAKKDTEASQWQVEILKENLVAQAIALFYQLSAHQISLALTNDAIARAIKLLRYQKHREQFGLIEAADRLQAEALLATRKMEKATAQANMKQGQVALNRLMLHQGNSLITTANHSTFIPKQAYLEALIITDLTESAVQQRPQFKVFDAQLDAATARLSQASDLHDSQVDVVAKIGSRASNGNASKAFSQGFSLNDRFISIGIEFSDTLGGRSTRAGITTAELQRQQVLLQKTQATEALRSDISSVLNRVISTQQTMKAAQHRAHAESKKFDAEITRYREGRSDTANIVQFEGDLRRAELQAALQEVSLKMAWQQLQLAQGSFFTNLAQSEVNP